MTESPTRTRTSPKIYQQARERVLKDLPKWRREEVLEMEASGNIDNHHYTDFVRQVIALAEDS